MAFLQFLKNTYRIDFADLKGGRKKRCAGGSRKIFYPEEQAYGTRRERVGFVSETRGREDVGRERGRKAVGRKIGGRGTRDAGPSSNAARKGAFSHVAPRVRQRARPSQQWRRPSHPIRTQ